MTDNEIIKALRCCADRYCKGCSERGKANCRESIAALAWDLIYRLQAENESKQATIDSFTDIGKLYSEIKAEAYKEAFEKVKEELKNIAKIDWQGGYYYLVGEAFFDNLLKELGGVITMPGMRQLRKCKYNRKMRRKGYCRCARDGSIRKDDCYCPWFDIRWIEKLKDRLWYSKQCLQKYFRR